MKASPHHTHDPYADPATNLIYQLLFCDDIDLYREQNQKPHSHPFDILFSETADPAKLQTIATDPSMESRLRLLAYCRLGKSGHEAGKKELLGVIVEVGLEEGLDVLAAFADGTARYINHSGKIIVWELAEENSLSLTRDLFSKCETILASIGPWDKPRLPAPGKGMARISLLVSDGLYFGEGPVNVLFNDPLAESALSSATRLMKYLAAHSMK